MIEGPWVIYATFAKINQTVIQIWMLEYVVSRDNFLMC